MENPQELTIRLIDEKNWYHIEAAFGTGGGVYRLYATKNGQRSTIPRVLDADDTGTLYIGRANSFLDRVINLKKAILPNYVSAAHDAGVRYKKFTGMHTKFPIDELMVHMTAGSNPIEMERQALDSYINRFGEVPPLNAI